MRREKGKPLPLGVCVGKDSVNFAIEVPEGKECRLLLYKKGEREASVIFEMPKKTESEVYVFCRFLILHIRSMSIII